MELAQERSVNDPSDFAFKIEGGKLELKKNSDTFFRIQV